MEIQFYSRNVYGIQKKYVLNPQTALHITGLTCKKTIDSSDMEHLTALFGVVWKQVLDPQLAGQRTAS